MREKKSESRDTGHLNMLNMMSVTLGWRKMSTLDPIPLMKLALAAGRRAEYIYADVQNIYTS